MKFFQQLLVAPAALGLISPMAANAADLSINDVSTYSKSEVATQSTPNFSDVHPSDWSYQAIDNLRKRRGCNVLALDGSMTRYEAALIVNKCLENVAELNTEEQSLYEEFGAELAVIRGRLDGIEAGVMDHSDHGFSATTKIHGKTIFLTGGVDQGKGGTEEAVTFTYHNIVEAETSFNGNDLLFHEFEACNAGNTPFTDAGTALESACDDGNALTLARSFYQFPMGDDWTATLGARVRQDNLLGVWPSAYPSDTVLDVLTYAGSNAAYNYAVGAGAGVTWTQPEGNLVASALFISQDAANASSQERTAGGLLTDHGRDDVTGQLAWVDDNFTVAAVVTKSDNGNWNDSVDAADRTAYGVGGFYTTDFESPYLPSSISAGLGWEIPDNETIPDTAADDAEYKNTWTVGLLWEDAFIEGNTLGFAVGTAEAHRDDSGYDKPLAYEVYYQLTVSDNITVTPALFVVQNDGLQNSDHRGAVVKTTFSF